MIAITLTVLAAASMATSSVVQTPNPDGFELLILHNNDMHARFEQTSQLSGTCTVADRDAGKCYGGFPRVAYVVKEARKAAASGEGPPVLYLNAGDTYTGTAWFTIYKWKIAAEFINALQPDAVALGNNELQKGATELSPFLQNLQTTVLSSNVILNSAKESTLEKSTIINVNGVNVGVISYLSPEASVLDSIGNIEYVDEVIALREEVDKLKEQNVNVIIALGHSTTNKEVDIAKEVDGVDLVIAGHKNTYYWNGTNAETLVPETTVITQLSGKQVPIIYSYAYNQYLGQIRVKFDNAGEIVEYVSEPILLDETVSQDYETSNIVNKLNADIASKNEEVVGVTAVVLDGDSCNREECNLGNLVTDAIMYHYATRFDGERWTDAPIAIIQSGAIFSSVSPSNRPASVTYGDLLAAIPEESTVVAVTMTGEVLKQLLERSVGNYSINNPTGQFLQFSGIRAVYDLAREPGSRLVDAVVRCWACFVPEYYAIDDWRDYKILMPIALANGANGYSMLVGLPQEAYEFDEVTCTAEYIELRSPVYPEVAGRITLLNLDAIEEEITGPDLTPEVDPEVDPEVEPEVDPDFGPEPLPDSAIAISSTLSIIFVCAIRLFLF